MKRNVTSTHIWNIADTITAIRIAAAFSLFFLPLRSAGFLALYTLAGLTDVLDGWLARKTGTAGAFGARLDSIADLLFYSMMLLCFFPVLRQTLPTDIWYAVAAILLVRLTAYIAAAIKYHRFAALHTWLNKLTGIGVFLIPYVFAMSNGVMYSWAVCVLALIASLEELIIHLCMADYRADRKSVFQQNQ